MLVGKVSEQDVPNDFFGPVELKVRLDLILKLSQEKVPVLLVYQTVIEDTVHFMQPQLG